MKNDYSIGEFSKITGLSIKTLRFYHEKGVLIPSSVDTVSGYRFYDASKIEKARVVMRLRQMEFSLEDILAVVGGCEDEADLLGYLERQKQFLADRIRGDREVVRSLTEVISKEKAAKQLLANTPFKVEEKVLEPLLMAGIRMKGKYSDCGAGFARLGKELGRYLHGKPFCLYYDGEYREDDADFEACFPIRKPATAGGISVRELPGGHALSLLHRGPYDQLGRSYAKILEQAKTRNVEVALPTREVYHKGPGAIFKGNPKHYVTEIQLPLTA